MTREPGQKFALAQPVVWAKTCERFPARPASTQTSSSLESARMEPPPERANHLLSADALQILLARRSLQSKQAAWLVARQAGSRFPELERSWQSSPTLPLAARAPAMPSVLQVTGRSSVDGSDLAGSGGGLGAEGRRGFTRLGVRGPSSVASRTPGSTGKARADVTSPTDDLRGGRSGERHQPARNPRAQAGSLVVSGWAAGRQTARTAGASMGHPRPDDSRRPLAGPDASLRPAWPDDFAAAARPEPRQPVPRPTWSVSSAPLTAATQSVSSAPVEDEGLDSSASSGEFAAEDLLDQTLADPGSWYGSGGLSTSHAPTQPAARSQHAQLHDSVIDAIMPLGRSSGLVPVRKSVSE